MHSLITGANTLPDLLLRHIQIAPDKAACRQYRNRIWISMTWREIGQEVTRWQAAMRSEGLKPGDRVGLSLRNCVEWLIFDQAALGLGLVTVPLYYGDRPDNMVWSLNDAGVRLLLLEDGLAWDLLQAQATTVERVVCLQKPAAPCQKVIHTQAWLPAVGAPLTRGPAEPASLATIVYTSGTTGRPKGVMLTHHNIISDLLALMERVPEFAQASQRFLSFLPLSHMFERTVGYYIPLCLDAEISYARGIPQLAEDFISQRPTIIVSVPRIFERTYTKIEATLPPGSLKRRLFEKTVDVGWKRFNKQASLLENLLWPLLDALVARKVRARLGGELRYITLGGAALSPPLLKTFIGLGLVFIHGYGLTETSPVVASNQVTDNHPFSVGRPLQGVEARTAENGELLIRGAIVSPGYWNNPSATQAAIDADGWFHTGDIAEIQSGLIHIRGRLKDVIVLSNGEKMPPADAEQAILGDAVFEQVMVVGEGRGALGLLVVSPLKDERELCARANKQLHAFPGYAQIRHVMRVHEAWTPENGMLTPTLKLKRHKIEEKYRREIEAMYRTRLDTSH